MRAQNFFLIYPGVGEYLIRRFRFRPTLARTVNTRKWPFRELVGGVQEPAIQTRIAKADLLKLRMTVKAPGDFGSFRPAVGA
jgi:hypothetical protein